MAYSKEIHEAVKDYVTAIKKLRSLGITPRATSFTCQVAEWLVNEIYDGTLAKSAIQRDWDLQVETKFYQVKAHAKSAKTIANKSSHFSEINKDEHAQIDELIIIVFSEDYQLKKFYKVPWKACLPLIRRHSDKDRIYWRDLQDYRLNASELPKQDIINIFS